MPSHRPTPSSSVSAHAPRTYDFLTSPGADIRDAGQPDLSAMRAELNRDLFLFARIIFGYRDLTVGFHLPLCRFLERWGTPAGHLPGGSSHFGYKRLMVAVPRESFKTSVCTRANSLWQVVRSRDQDYDATVAIFNNVEQNARDWVAAIRDVVMSSREFQDIYRDLLPKGVHYTDQARGVTVPRGHQWNANGLRFQRLHTGIPEHCISGWGVGGSSTGRHWTHVIKDDLIGEKEAKSDAEMERVWHWCQTARYLERPAEAGNELIVHTRWTYGDIYRRFRTEWPDDYLLYHRRALERDPETGEEYSTFPEKWSVAALQRMRSNPTRQFYFSAQMQSEPAAGIETSFDSSWHRFGTVVKIDRQYHHVIDTALYSQDASKVPDELAPRNVALSQMDKALLWDPIPAEEATHDQDARHGLLVVGRDPWGRDHALWARGIRLDPLDILHLAIRTAIQWGAGKIAVEEVNFSKLYRFWGEHLLRTEYRSAPLQFIPLKEERRSKDTRIQALIPDWRAGFIYLNEPETRQLVVEANEYPYGRTRDLLDAFAMREEVLSRPRTTGEIVHDAWETTRKTARHDRYRGPYDHVNWTH